MAACRRACCWTLSAQLPRETSLSDTITLKVIIGSMSMYMHTKSSPVKDMAFNAERDIIARAMHQHTSSTQVYTCVVLHIQPAAGPQVLHCHQAHYRTGTD